MYAFLADRSLLSKGCWLALIPLTPLVVTSSLIYVIQGFQREAVVAVVRSQNVDSNLRQLLGVLADAEGGQRAFLLSGNEQWLQPAQTADGRVKAIVERLNRASLEADSRDRLNGLSTQIARHLAALGATAAEARRLGQFPTVLPASRFEADALSTASIRDELTNLIRRERDTIALRLARTQRLRRDLVVIATTGAAAGMASGVFVLVLFTSGISSRVRVLNRSADCLARGLPLPSPPVGRDEIGALGQNLHLAAALLAARDQELRHALETVDRFFTLVIDPLCVAGFDGYFKRLNPAWPSILGWPADELLERPFLDFVHPDDRAATARETEKIGEGHISLSFENRYRCRDGTYRWLQWVAVPDVERKLIYAVARDVTAAKEADAHSRRLTAELGQRNAQLTALNHELEAFSYSVSHDLRAPLRSVDGFSQVLLEDYGDRLDQEGKDALQRVRAAATGMGELIDALLELSRLTRIELRTEPVDLSGLARTIAEELRRSDPGRTAELVIAPNIHVEGDRRLLTAVLRNLLGNAWKYSQPRATTRIEFGSVTRENETVYFVRDNGVGFDMAYVGKLFGAFQRLHRQAEFAGTGIGLATVQRIVHRHGGRTWAEGAVERGATFYFTLRRPLANDDTACQPSAMSVSVS